MASVKKQIEDMMQTLDDGLDDAEKHDSGNKAAGGRVRKTLQAVTVQCKDLRKQVQDARKTE